MGQEDGQSPAAPGGQQWSRGKRVFEGEIIRNGNKIDGYNGSLERQEGVKVPDKKAKLTPAFQTKSKEGSVVDETVNVLPMKVKLEKITKENADLQTELKQKITKLLS